MAREWAHYRYGVYDEGGIPDDPRHPSGYLTFQTDSSELIARANTCSDNQQPRGNWIRCDCLEFQLEKEMSLNVVRTRNRSAPSTLDPLTRVKVFVA